MTSTIGKAAAAKAFERLAGASGVQGQVAALLAAETGRTAETVQLRMQNVSAEISEKAGLVKYPWVSVYCHKVVNDFKEKFRTFSGRVWLAIEVRHSQDRLEGLEARLQACADAVALTLDGARGDWDDGMYYAGGYEVVFGGVKHGGKNFIQTATVTFAVEVGR
jgi:hypothetical protein